jgi:hypothetical protein
MKRKVDGYANLYQTRNEEKDGKHSKNQDTLFNKKRRTVLKN